MATTARARRIRSFTAAPGRAISISRQHLEAQAADELPGRGHHVDGPAPRRIEGKAGLARERPESLAAPPAHRREPDDADRAAILAPHVLHGLAEAGRRMDGSVRDETAPLAQLPGGDRA